MNQRRGVYAILGFWLTILALVLTTGFASAQDGDNPGAPDVNPSVESDHDPSNVESADDVGGDVADDVSRDSPIEYWQFLCAGAAVWIVEAAKRRGWTVGQKTAAMVGVSAVLGIGGAWFRGELDNFTFTSAAVIQLVVYTQVGYRVLSQLPGVGTALAKWGELTGGDPAPPKT